MFRTKKLIAIAATTLAASAAALAGTPLAPVSDAAAATSIQGTVIKTDSNTRVASAGIWLYRWDGSQWISLGKKTTTNSSGTYAISGLADGYWYAVRAYRTYGACFVGYGLAAYDGFSRAFYAGGGARGETVRISYVGHISC